MDKAWKLCPREKATLRSLKKCKKGLTLRELSAQTGYPEASVSCSIRALRRKECGAFKVQKTLSPDSCHPSKEYVYFLS